MAVFIIYPQADTAPLDLLKLNALQMRQLRGRQIAAVFQDSELALHPSISVGEQIVSQLRRCGQTDKHKATERMLQLLTMLELPDPVAVAQRLPSQFSGGQRQRCALAIALAGEPQVLLADEITSALDPRARCRMLQLLLQLKTRQHLSVLLVTHDLAAAAAVADRIGVMYGGRLVEIGNAEEILNMPRHPYIQVLIAAQPAAAKRGQPLPMVAGNAPLLCDPPQGDLFALRDPQARVIDLVQRAPFFALSATHAAATWHLHNMLCGQNYPLADTIPGGPLD